MQTLIIELPGDERVPRLLRLEPGDSVRFGRGAPGTPVDFVLDDPAVARLAGEVTAAEDYWALTNYSRSTTYVVENPEGAGEHVKVTPGRVGAPVPFEISRVVLPGRQAPVYFRVFAPLHAHLDPRRTDPGDGSGTLSAFPLDETAKYFLVLVALCERRLRDESVVAIPSVPAVVERLRPLPSCRDLTAEAVNFHVDYLAREKLRIRTAAAGERAADPGGFRREAVVSLALRFDLVREEHLNLLPARVKRRASVHGA
ncbi:hypothetical protein GCM10010172_35030 [Paractinoplanes ferrugineus]|uniref:FHA domain-containing protein n=1 Tax=Paractinoplanes ferrugineus TaxID=113564 RepID=A0A919MHY0_9ACTN|nr:serine/threonine protein kinase [Actinoplanes ferrugineus]GIE15424.1 hypothetical protein Afe05nite_72640 [Actinoplanes ferrugineus]